MAKRKTTTARPRLVNAPPSTNGHVTNGAPGGPRRMTREETTRNEILEAVTNLTSLRRDFLANLLDPRRNVDRECGYPDSVTDPNVYQRLYMREPVARRVVQIWPKETWQVQPLIYEDEDPEVVTPFERAWDDLARQLRGGSMYQDEAGNPVWEYLLRADILSGIGQFGVVLMGIDDGLRLDQPAEGVTDGREDPNEKKDDPSKGLVTSKPDDPTKMSNSPWGSFQDTLYSQTSLAPPRAGRGSSDGLDADFGEEGSPGRAEDSLPPRFDAEREKDDPSVEPLMPEDEGKDEGTETKRKLLFLRVFGENLTQISRWCSDPLSPRFGMPEMYRITLSDPQKQSSGIGQPSTTVDVHWTRVIHVADNLDSSETLGTPRMQPVLNRLIDLAKISGAAGEGYWKQAFATLVLESNPQLAGDVDVNRDDIRNQLENLDGGLQKSLVLLGLQAKTLPPSVTDPTPFVESVINQICVALECPVRVFKGSERGELASSQDDAAWNDRLKARQSYYVTPRIVIPFIDRLIAMGVLPKPTSGKKKLGDLAKGKRDAEAEAKPAPGAVPPGEEGGEAGEGGGPEGGKPSFPPFKKPGGGGGFGGKPKFNAILFGKRPPAQAIDAKDPDAAPVDDDAIDDDSLDPDDTDPFGDDDGTGAEASDPQLAEAKSTPGYSVEWPDIDSMTDAERATVFNTRVTAWAAYVAGGVDQLIPPEFAMTHLDQFTDEEALAIMAEGVKRQEETLAREAALMEEQGFAPDPTNPGAMIDPDQQEAENEIELAKAENPAGVQQSGPPSPFGAKPGAGGPPGEKPNPFAKNEELTMNFDPDQPRDADGKWGAGGGSRLQESKSKSMSKEIKEKLTLKSNNLTPRVKAALSTYQSNEGHSKINGSLRKGELDEETSSIVADIDESMTALDSGVTLMRSIGSGEKFIGSKDFYDKFTKDNVGREFSDDAYTSTTTTKSVAEGFMWGEHAALIKINVPPGTKMVKMPRGEGEIVLERGLKFRIDKVETVSTPRGENGMNWSGPIERKTVTLTVVGTR